MLKYERINLEEKEIETKIMQAPELIEDGLIYLEHQRKTEKGRLDILFVDGSKILVVAELKIIQDENMLMQALDYFDFVSEKIEGFARIHKKYNIDVAKYPRLMLIAPSFSSLMINRCKWLSPEIRITLICYQYLKFENNEDTIVFIPQEITEQTKILTKAPELNELLSYINNNKAKELAKKILDETEKNWDDIVVDPLQWGKSVKYKGNVLYYWEPRRTGVKISLWDENASSAYVLVTSQEEYERVIKLIKLNIEKYWEK